MSMLRIEACASYLVACRSGLRPKDLPQHIAPQDFDEAYRIQSAVAERRGETAGFKVGLTNTKAQLAAGLETPIVGRLAPSDIVESGHHLTLSRAHLRVVEAEVIFEMGEDLRVADAPFSFDQIARSVGAAYAGLEICDSRYE